MIYNASKIEVLQEYHITIIFATKSWKYWASKVLADIWKAFLSVGFNSWRAHIYSVCEDNIHYAVQNISQRNLNLNKLNTLIARMQH